jgi:hypothetical protein
MDKILSIREKCPRIMSFKALVIFLLILLTPAISRASVIASNLESDVFVENTQGSGNSNIFYQRLGTGLSGTIGSLSLYLGGAGSSPSMNVFYGWAIYCFNDSGYTSSCGIWGETAFNQTILTAGVYTFGSSTAYVDGHAVGHTLDQTKYYQFMAQGYGNWPSSHMDWYGGSTLTYPQVICPDCSLGSLGNLYFVLDTNSTPTPPVTDTTTHIISFTPEDNSTTTSPVTFTMHAYVNPDDIGAYIGVKFTLHNIDQNVLLLSAFSPNDIYLLDGFNATTSGDFYFATSTTLADGNYRLEAMLERSYLGGWIVNPFSPINEDISHQFIVGSSTFIGNISQNGFSELQAIFASTTATSTTAVAQNCNPLGSFDVVKCGAFLFIPGGDYLNTTMKGLKDGVLTRVPWGYLTRTYNIWNASATTSLPSFTASVRTGPGDDMTPDVTTITIDPGDMIAGAGTLLDDTRDPIYNKNAKDVFGPLVQLVLAVSVIFTIIADLTGSHRHHADVGERQTKLS